MTAMVLPAPDGREAGTNTSTESYIQVLVHIQTEILDSEFVRRRANIWLGMNAGHLVMVENPELLLLDPLQWRFDVILSVPRQDRPGTVTRNRIGQIRLDALTGEVAEPALLVEELTANAGALADH